MDRRTDRRTENRQVIAVTLCLRFAVRVNLTILWTETTKCIFLHRSMQRTEHYISALSELSRDMQGVQLGNPHYTKIIVVCQSVCYLSVTGVHRKQFDVNSQKSIHVSQAMEH